MQQETEFVRTMRVISLARQILKDAPPGTTAADVLAALKWAAQAKQQTEPAA